MKRLKTIFHRSFDTAFFSQLLVIAVPIMVENFLSSFVNMLDTFMIGRLGEIEIAAAGLGNQVFFLFNFLLFGIGSSAGIFSSQFWGRKNLHGIKQTTGLCFIVSIATGMVFTLGCVAYPSMVMRLFTHDAAVIAAGAVYLRISAVSYIPFACSLTLILMLRSVEQVRITVLVSFIALSCNAVLNFLLIFGYAGFPQLGISGAALATVISRFIELIVIFGITKKKRYPVIGGIAEMFSFSLAFVSKYFLIGAPIVLNEFLWAFGFTMQNKIFAASDTAAYAAFTIMNTALQLSNVVLLGLGTGSCVLTAKKIGEKDYKTAQHYAKQLTAAEILIAVILAVIFLLPLSFFFPSFFKVSEKTAAIMQQLFFVLIIIYPVKAFNMNMIVGIFRAGGDTKFCLFYDIFFMWALSIPLGFFAARQAFCTPVILYCILSLEELLKMPFGLFRLRTGKWLRSVID